MDGRKRDRLATATDDWHLQTPTLEISGALLEGVEVELEDDDIPAIAPAPIEPSP